MYSYWWLCVSFGGNYAPFWLRRELVSQDCVTRIGYVDTKRLESMEKGVE